MSVTLSDWAKKNIGQAGGAPKKAAHKRTTKKVKVGKAEYTVFEGPRGGKYVLKNGKFVPVEALKAKK